MKILWIVNIVLPELAAFLGIDSAPSGTWMIDLSKSIAEKNNIELAVACVYGSEFQKHIIDNITYYVIPGSSKSMMFYDKSLSAYWKKIDSDFKPDIIQLHGTEYSHGLSYMKAFPDKKYIVSMQGVLNEIKKVDCIGFNLISLLKYRSASEWKHFNGIAEMHILHSLNSRHEKEILKRASYANGTNNWDTGCAKKINPNLKTFKIEYNLRDEFYFSDKWSVEKCRRHSIFTAPSGVPLKGLIQLLKAVNTLKEKYPDILIIEPGFYPDKNGLIKGDSGFIKYLNDYIKKNNLQSHIKFIGKCSASDMVNAIKDANLSVVASAVESTGMIMRECMILGCPSIVSYRGGLTGYITDGVDGLYYKFEDYKKLAQLIEKVFDDDSFATKLSANAIITAENRQNRNKNISDYMEMVKYINDKEI